MVLIDKSADPVTPITWSCCYWTCKCHFNEGR